MSVFTFDPDPPRVSSPWLRSAAEQSPASGGPVQAGLLSDYGVTKLEAEPQEGPTEYKLHLLLRPRRQYQSMSTTDRIPGSSQSRSAERGPQKSSSLGPAQTSSSPQSRQARLEHLTTQLLWRLQQSCPYHAASTTVELVIPRLPLGSIQINGPIKIGKPLPGLEMSRGALYEIGVADDGTLVGLTKVELDESLVTLRIMAASLGCTVEVIRRVIVGECEWLESACATNLEEMSAAPVVQQAKLWVAEALVTPELGSRDTTAILNSPQPRISPRPSESLPDTKHGPLTTHQLRVTLTGPTTSGKSTLLGTLSTGTLDNGHGNSRLSLLKHRHEVVSGLTSSVAQELIGYNRNNILNYSHSGIESWIDIHDYTKDGRLVFLLDSAGHPRYRRTILRGIVGWAPDWTLLCISACDVEAGRGPRSTSPSLDLGSIGSEVDLSMAHLELCLSLGVPLAIVMTKLDLATKTSLPRTLGRILTAIKNAGRIPKMLQSKSQQSKNGHLTDVPAVDLDLASKVVNEIGETRNLLTIVPIVLTSAVSGSGIGLVHALLQNLPLPPPPTSHDHTGLALNPEQPASLFHIEDRFSLPASYASLAQNQDQQEDAGTVVAGYLRFGRLTLGDKILVGPFPADDDDLRGVTPDDRPSPGSYGCTLSHPSSAELARIAMRNAVSASTIKGEWFDARIVSIRNLRLPVESLEAGQVGSVGILLDLPKEETSDDFFEPAVIPIPKIRKGMVLAIPSKHMIETGLSLQAASGLTAIFTDERAASLTLGSLVNIYVASVRTAARVVHISRSLPAADAGDNGTEEPDGVFTFNEKLEAHDDEAIKAELSGNVEVQLELMTNREWIELGAQILILEGGARDKTGLEGYVGKIVEIVD